MEHLVDIFDEEKLPESLRSVVTDALDGVQRAARIGQSLAALVSSVGQPTSSVARPISLVEVAERERSRTQTRWSHGAARGLTVASAILVQKPYMVVPSKQTKKGKKEK
jgi:hypothetical protein